MAKTLSNFRSVYDQINIHIRGLEALGVNADQCGSLLVQIVMSRLPNQISLQIFRHTSQDVWTLGDLLDLLVIDIIQKIALLGTAMILRKVLSL